MTAVAMKLNEELNGIELYFNTKPATEVLTNLKANSYRWSNFKKCWYAKQSEKTLQVATALTTDQVTPVTIAAPATKVKSTKQTLSLWESTQWNNETVNKYSDCKQVAKEIRTHIRKRFPGCKFSVTVPYYGRISFTIKSTPFAKESTYLKAIQGYCTELLNSYNECHSPSDPYTDCAGVYNFHGWVEIGYDYKQTDITEDTQKSMTDFDNKLSEYKMLEEEKKKEEFKAYQAECEKKNAEYAIRQQEKKQQNENIYNSIEVVDLDENNQYFITGSEFANLNKNNTLDEYKEEVNRGAFTYNDVKVTKEIHFTNETALERFSNMLLTDFDFLANTGGNFTEDNRINSMTDFYNIGDFERNTVKWNVYGVAIYFDNKLQFIVDAQGHSYARYVGLTDNAKIEKVVTTDQHVSEDAMTDLQLQAAQLEDISTTVIDELGIYNTWNNEDWTTYKNILKDKLKTNRFKLTKEIIQQLDIEELKVSMYKLLTEVDGIQDQFNNANIQPGDKLTLFYISDWGGIITDRITFDSVENSKYAQYDNAVKLTFTPEKKRKQYYKHFYSTMLVYKGFHTLPDAVLHEVTETDSMRTSRSKYHSCDNRQYDEIISYFDQNGLRPIINTYKPLF